MSVGRDPDEVNCQDTPAPQLSSVCKAPLHTALTAVLGAQNPLFAGPRKLFLLLQDTLLDLYQHPSSLLSQYLKCSVGPGLGLVSIRSPKWSTESLCYANEEDKPYPAIQVAQPSLCMATVQMPSSCSPAEGML